MDNCEECNRLRAEEEAAYKEANYTQDWEASKELTARWKDAAKALREHEAVCNAVRVKGMLFGRVA